MKVDATTIEEFFNNSGDFEPVLRQVDSIIQEVTGEAPTLCDGMGSIVMLGYKMGKYKPRSAKKSAPFIDWPVIALAPQKNYVAVYICALSDKNSYLLEEYEKDLGKVSCGKSCLRFKKIDDLNLAVFKKLIKEAYSKNPFQS